MKKHGEDYKMIQSTIQEFATLVPHRRTDLRDIHNNGEFIVATNGHVLVEMDLKIWKDFDFGTSNVLYPNWKSVIPSVKEEMMNNIPYWDDLFTDPDRFIHDDEDDLYFDLIKINGRFFQCKYINLISRMFTQLSFINGKLWIPKPNNDEIPALFIQPGMGIRCVAMPVAMNVIGGNLIKEIEIH